LHGFLSYLVRCNVEGREYSVFGYKGKQVRDNIHSFDVARCIELFWENPKPASVFNLGGGRDNSISILEAFAKAEELTGKPMKWKYVDEPRRGDHICYISDLSALRAALPTWELTKSLDDIFEEIVEAWQKRLAGAED
jgi:CDP-paratose 2-epimerase